MGRFSDRHKGAGSRPGLGLVFLCPESHPIMQTLQSVLDQMPAGGIVKYNTYRHTAIRSGWNGNGPHSRDEAFRPFLNLVVVLTAPEAYDHETDSFFFDEANEEVLGVVSLHSWEFFRTMEDCPKGYDLTWRYLCQPLCGGPFVTATEAILSAAKRS